MRTRSPLAWCLSSLLFAGGACGDGEGPPNPPTGEDDGGDTSCPAGTEACPCFGNETCHMGLSCWGGVCQDLGGTGDETTNGSTGPATTTTTTGDDGCPEGTESCACFPNESCFDGLDCVGGFCEPGTGDDAGCEVGGPGCGCFANATCLTGLDCIGGVCVNEPSDDGCDVGTEGCACFPNLTCFPALSCFGGVCVTGDGDGTTSGDGDGTTSGDGDGTTSGDGDGTTSGDGDGDGTTSGDGDGDGDGATDYYTACPSGNDSECEPGEQCVTGTRDGQDWSFCTPLQCQDDGDCDFEAGDFCADLPGDGVGQDFCVSFDCTNDACPSGMFCGRGFFGTDVCVWPIGGDGDGDGDGDGTGDGDGDGTSGDGDGDGSGGDGDGTSGDGDGDGDGTCGGPDPGDGQLCGSAYDITVGSTPEVRCDTTVGGGSHNNAVCTGAGQSDDRTYDITPSIDGDLTITVVPEATFDAQVHALTSCLDIQSGFACINDGAEGATETLVIAGATASTTYAIVVDGVGGSEGAYTVTFAVN